MMYRNNPLISIYIITENDEKFLPSCLDSLINQTYTNFEIVIRDNCSVDGSYDIAVEYQRKFKERNIYCLVQENKRRLEIPNCERLCRRECEGEFMLNMEPDTALKGDCLEQCAHLFVENTDVGVIILGGKEFEPQILDGEALYNEYDKYINIKRGCIIERYIVRAKAQSRNIDFQYHSHLYKLFSDASISKAAVLHEDLVTSQTDSGTNIVEKNNFISYIIEKYQLLLYIGSLAKTVGYKGFESAVEKTAHRLAEMCVEYAEIMKKEADLSMEKKCLYLAKVFDADIIPDENISE